MHRQVALLLAVLLYLVGCAGGSKAGGKMSRPQLEAWLQENAKLTEVSLVEGKDGSYAGTAKGQDGMLYRLKVTQQQRKVSWEGKHEEAGSVSSFSGSKSW